MRLVLSLRTGVYLASLCIPVYAQTSSPCVNESLANEYVQDNRSLPYLQARFPLVQISPPRGNPYTGHQNFTFCCLQAVNHFLQSHCQDDSMIRVDQGLLAGGQFPCGAQWIGNTSGAPEVRASYAWSSKNCPGWEESPGNNPNSWAQLLVGFVLPAVVFSFNVPRPRKLRIWQGFFPKDIGNQRLLAGLVGAIGAGVCVIIDAILWLMVTFAFAGPCILSGLYEAQLDKRALAYVEESNEHGDLQLGLTARILFSVLCGNLDVNPAWSDTMDLTTFLDMLDQGGSGLLASRQSAPRPTKSPASTEMTQLPESSLQPSPVVEVASPLLDSPRNIRQPGHSGHGISELTDSDNIGEGQLVENIEVHNTSSTMTVPQAAYDHVKTIKKVTVRLRAMLASQYSFGTTTGGPVVFFLGSFLFALLQLKEAVGDDNQAEALAFGILWMIIPHVGVVSSCLLAGNNPNILEGIVGVRDCEYKVGDDPASRRKVPNVNSPNHSTQAPGSVKRTLSDYVERVYDAEYRPAWMWDRGRCKFDWLLILFADSWNRCQPGGQMDKKHQDRLIHFLDSTVMLSVDDWIFLWLFAFLLLFAPWVLGFLVAYFSPPPLGLACRTFTFLVYLPAQVVLLLLWTYHLTWNDEFWVLGREINRPLQEFRDSDSKMPSSLRKALKKLVKLAQTTTTQSNDCSLEGQNLQPSDRSTKTHNLMGQISLYILGGCCAFLSLFASIAGSMMQVMGVYRNNLCLMTTAHWLPPNRGSAWLLLSSNSALEIYEARRHWIVIGAISVGFLGVVCYIGWWYQKGLRARFTRAASQLEKLDKRQGAVEMCPV